MNKLDFKKEWPHLYNPPRHNFVIAELPPLHARLHQEWLPANGYVENGKHHEIYLGDPRKTAPAKLKTILRQPVRPI